MTFVHIVSFTVVALLARAARINVRRDPELAAATAGNARSKLKRSRSPDAVEDVLDAVTVKRVRRRRHGDFEKQQLLGTGGFADTFLGRDSRTGEKVAIKHLKVTTLDKRQHLATVQALPQRAISEAHRECAAARTIARRVALEAQGFFVDCLLDLPEDPSKDALMVLELAGMRTLLKSFWGDGEYYPVGMEGNGTATDVTAGLTARRFRMAQLTEAVAALAQARLSHHDLKFDNAVVHGPEDYVRVIDYGAMVDLDRLSAEGAKTVAWSPHAPWWSRDPTRVHTPAEGLAYDAHSLGMMWLLSEIYPPEGRMPLVVEQVRAVLRDDNGYKRRNNTHPTRSSQVLREAISGIIDTFSHPGWFDWYKPGMFTLPPPEAFDFIVELLKEHPAPVQTLLRHPFVTSAVAQAQAKLISSEMVSSGNETLEIEF